MKDNRLVIFDMDGTIYDINDVVKMSYEMQVRFMSMKMNCSEIEAGKILANNHIYPIIKKDSRSATEFFFRQGIDRAEWSEYREKHFDIQKINVAKAASEDVIRRFTNIGQLVLLSSNTYHIISKILNHLNISPSIFSAIMCSDDFLNEKVFNKKVAMQLILHESQVPSRLLLSIGDRYETDIAPALEIGGEGVLLKSSQVLVDVYEDLMEDHLHTNNKYVYFKN